MALRNPLNRRMRTRMSGGVAGESGRPLPLCRLVLGHGRERTAKSGCATNSATGITGRTAARPQGGRPLQLQFPPMCGGFVEAAPSCFFRDGAGDFLLPMAMHPEFSVFDLARARVLTWVCLGRGA